MDREIKDSWLAEYLRYTSGQESPEMFHIWVAMILIASMLERNVWIDRGYYVLFPNIYVILVAGTAKCHKSVAVNMGVKNILPNVESAPRTFAQKITNERLIQFLSEGADVEDGHVTFKAAGLIAATELASFLGKSAMDTGIITTLTDLYDSPREWSYETKGAGQHKLENVCINLIGASTGKWLRAAIPNEAVGGGFISRTVFVYQDSPKRLIAFPEDEIPEDVKKIKNRLLNDLEKIGQIKGEYKFSPEAKEWYKEWYVQDAESIKGHEDADFFTRWPQIMLKIAMVSAAAESSELVLRTRHLKAAHMYLEAVKASMTPVIRTMTMADSELPTEKVLGLIKRRKRITHERLSRYTNRYVKAEGLKQILQTLEESGYIKTHLGKGTREYAYLEDDL